MTGRGARPGALVALVERVEGPVDAELAFVALGGAGADPAVWLDSAAPGVGTGRFSYLVVPGGERQEVVLYDAGTRTVEVRRPGRPVRHLACDLFGFLARRVGECSLTVRPDVPFAFVGGYVGWIGYECQSTTGGAARHRASTPGAALLFADRLVVVDHQAGDAYLVALSTEGGEGGAREWLGATRRLLVGIRGHVASDPPGPAAAAPAGAGGRPAQPDLDRAAYLAGIAWCQERLRAGDTYQVCLTTQFRRACPEDPFLLYRRLRRGNPAPYGAYLAFGDTAVCSSSPERFLRIGADGAVEARPIKGTAPRSADPARDRRQREALAADPKERAENLMIVDLLRNDLGRVCRPGSIGVPSLMAVESFETVHQMVSTIRGQLRPEVTAARCLRAAFPGGSMTGAPKIRTMEIIDELERSARGVYSGAIGYLGIDGAAELSIVIRTAVVHRGELSVGAGGAITVLSRPEAEWDEVLLKARAVLDPLGVPVAEDGAPAPAGASAR